MNADQAILKSLLHKNGSLEFERNSIVKAIENACDNGRFKILFNGPLFKSNIEYFTYLGYEVNFLSATYRTSISWPIKQEQS